MYQRDSDGLWVAAITLPASGGKQRRSVVYAATKNDVLVKKVAREAELAKKGDLGQRGDRTRVADYMTAWLDGKEVRPKTREQYDWIVSDT